MSITTRTRVSELAEYPEALDVLSEWGIDVGSKEMSWTLERLARHHGLSARELRVDLLDALAEEGADWEGGFEAPLDGGTSDDEDNEDDANGDGFEADQATSGSMDW